MKTRDGQSVLFYGSIVSPFVQTKALVHLDRIRPLVAGDIPPPVTCEVDLADGFCNQACPHCFHGTHVKREPVFLQTETATQLIHDLAARGTRAVELVGGGEPTTHADIAQISLTAAGSGLDVGLVTNGALLHRVESIAHAYKFVRVSLDAASATTYRRVHGQDHFARVTRNVAALAALGVCDLGCGYLIVPDNVGEIVAAAELVRSLGCRFIQFRPATLPYPVDADVWRLAERNVETAASLVGADDFQVFGAGIKWTHLTEPRHFDRCLTSPLVAVVKANGDIALCILRRNERHNVIGNIYQGGFFAHWGSDRHRALVDAINVHACPRPCKHDSYNIVAEAVAQDLFHSNFL